MQFSNRDNDLCSIELDDIFTKSLLLLEDLVKLTTVDERHDKVEARLRLEHPLHAAQERVIGFK